MSRADEYHLKRTYTCDEAIQQTYNNIYVMGQHDEEIANEPVALLGPNGIGKTSIARDMAEIKARFNHGIGLGCQSLEELRNEPLPTMVDCNDGSRPGPGEHGYLHLNLSSHEPEDLAMPNIDELIYRRLVSSGLPGSDNTWTKDVDVEWEDVSCTVVLEEIAKKPECFKIVSELLDGTLGTEYKVPPKVNFILTANRVEDAAGAHEFHNDLANRAARWDIQSSSDAFVEHHKGELHPLIGTLIKYNGNAFLFTQKDEKNGEPFASPRSVMKVNKYLMAGLDLDDPLSQPAILGSLGYNSTATLFDTYRAAHKFGDLDAMIQDPDKYKDKIDELRRDSTPNGRQLIVSIIAMLASRLNPKAASYKDASGFNKMYKFVSRFDDEMAVAFSMAAVTVNPDVRKEGEFVNHYVDNQDFYF